MNRLVRRLVPLAAGACMALLAGGLLAPTPARAVCSPFVVMRGHGDGTSGLRQDDLTILSEARLRGDQGQAMPPSPDRPSPCRGAFCSRNPVLPVAPTLPAGPQRAEIWACVELSPLRCALRSLAFRDAPRAARPVHVAFPPDRPPRSA